MPSSLQRFRTYDIAEEIGGASLELWRTDREVVCLASQPEKHRWVELHVVSGIDTQDPSAVPAVESFRDVIQSLLRIRDRRILEVLEAGEDEGALFYVTEFIDGEILDGYLARCKPLPAWWAVELTRQLTKGLLALRATPALLARVQVFNARLTLEGEAATDALVKLADFHLGAPPTATISDARAAEDRAVKEVGRLLCYALSGVVAEQMTPRQASALPVPPEVGDLLLRLLDSPGRANVRDLSALHTALAACAISPALASPPARLSPALRPRLPLAAHFPTLPRIAAEVGERVRLERAAFDAAFPYAQRAVADTHSVVIQLLPPARLMTSETLASVRRASERLLAKPNVHALNILELPTLDDPGWFLEEAAPRISLGSLRRLRPALSPAEAAFVMKTFDQAVQSLEHQGLAPAALCPQDVFIEFTDATHALPGDDQLASHPVTAWPPFRCKMRTYPTATHFAQPSRFLRERLLDPCPHRPAADPPPAPPPGLGSPSAGDYAALFAWLCGGLPSVPSDHAPRLLGALDGTARITRAALIDSLLPLIPRPVKSAPSRSAPPANSSRPVTKTSAKPKRNRASLKLSNARPKPAAPAEAVPLGSSGPSTPPEPTTDESNVPFALGSALLPDPSETWESEGGASPETTQVGFAEALLGSSIDSPLLPIPDVLAPTPDAPDDSDEDLPIGMLFGARTSDLDTDPLAASQDPRFDFSSRTDDDEGPGWGRLVILVVLVAMVIAAVMAHFTGLAPWR
ncbi:MAG: hypothetical protein ACKV19_28410 [Verrucomicrobiales bacterium]